MKVIVCDQCHRNVEFTSTRLFEDFGTSFEYIPCPHCKNMIDYNRFEDGKSNRN